MRQLAMLERPVQFGFRIVEYQPQSTPEQPYQTPWQLSLTMAPLSSEGNWLPPPNGIMELLKQGGIKSLENYTAQMVGHMQRLVRGRLGRKRFAEKKAGREFCKESVAMLVERTVEHVKLRKWKVMRLQARPRF